MSISNRFMSGLPKQNTHVHMCNGTNDLCINPLWDGFNRDRGHNAFTNEAATYVLSTSAVVCTKYDLGQQSIIKLPLRQP